MSNKDLHFPKERTSKMWQVMSDTVMTFKVTSHLQSESPGKMYRCQQYHLQGIVTVNDQPYSNTAHCIGQRSRLFECSTLNSDNCNNKHILKVY